MAITLEEFTVTEQRMLAEWLERVEGKLDASIRDCGVCRERLVRVEDSSKAAHHRLDDLPTPIKPSFSWREWLALALAGGAGIGAAVKSFFFSGSGK